MTSQSKSMQSFSDLEAGNADVSTLEEPLLSEPSNHDSLTHNEAAPSRTTLSLSLYNAHADPMQFTTEEMHQWIITVDAGKYAALAPSFAGLTGSDMCFLTSEQMTLITPTSAQGAALYNRLKAARKASENSRRMAFKKLESESLGKLTDGASPNPGSKDTQQGDFPALLFIPSMPVTLAIIAVSTIAALLLTVWSEYTESFTGVSTQTIIAYGSIPLIAMGFTYFHIWLALYMTFYPLTYVGIGPQIPGTNVGFPLGWQGIIPFKAEKMARMAVNLMTTQLIDVKTEFSKIDVARVALEMDNVVLEKLEGVIDRTFKNHQRELWEMLPQAAKDEIVVMGSEAGPDVIRRIMSEVKEDILSVFDIESFVVSFMTSNKSLLNKVFIKCGWDELCFIRDCGAILGGFFGFLQMLIWIPLHPEPADEFMKPGWQSLTVFLGFGLVVGCATNWLALKIIFEPVEPIKLFGGCYTLQGLFLKRQKEISAVYGKITATEVLSARNIIREMLEGPNSPVLKAMIRKHLERGCDEFIGVAVRPLVVAAVGETVDKMRDEAVEAIMSDLANTMVALEDYTQEALDMENTMSERMGALPAKQFERLLHPVFEEDEWKLIVMGGVLGVAIGALQAYFIN